MNELQDWRTFLALNHRGDKTDSIDGRARYEVSFIVATVPDYVDSNAGWVADQSLTAIQSAMSRSGHLLDRFRLIDWTRTDPRTDAPVANDSRLHERQPGALDPPEAGTRESPPSDCSPRARDADERCPPRCPAERHQVHSRVADMRGSCSGWQTSPC